MDLVELQGARYKQTREVAKLDRLITRIHYFRNTFYRLSYEQGTELEEPAEKCGMFPGTRHTGDQRFLTVEDLGLGCAQEKEK